MAHAKFALHQSRDVGRVTRLIVGLVVTGIAMASASGASARERNVPAPLGPPPEWTRFRELGEQAIRGQLVDPDSARFEWPNGYSPEGFRPFLSRHRRGYATCGTINARNRMGGFTGRVAFVVVIDQDQVVYSEVANRGGDLLAAACERASVEGRLPPAPHVAALGPPDSTLAAMGLSTVTASNGIVVISVEANSIAARAGIRQGALLTHFNGIALGGLTEDVLQRILGSAEGQWVFTLLDGSSVNLIPARADAGGSDMSGQSAAADDPRD